MDCRQCGTPLERPGDFCLTCRSPNTDAVVLDLARDRATVTCLCDGEPVARRTVTTHPEDDPEQDSGGEGHEQPDALGSIPHCHGFPRYSTVCSSSNCRSPVVVVPSADATTDACRYRFVRISV